MPNVSLVMSVRDNLSQPMQKMTASTRSLEQQLKNTGAKLDELNRKKATISVDAERAKRELREAKKGLDDTRESAERLEKAQFAFDTLQKELRGISQEARQAEKDLSSLQGAAEKAQNRASGVAGQSGGGAASSGGILERLAGAGIVSAAGNILSQAAGTYVSSAYGTDAASMLSAVLSGAGSGAAIGTAVSPGIGTAVGAGVGAVGGVISGGLQKFSSQDDYFKAMVQDQVAAYEEKVANSLSSGTATASSRETADLAFKTLLGDAGTAKDWLDYLQRFAADTPFGFSNLTSMSRTMLSYGVGTGEQGLWMNAIGNAGSARGLSGADLTSIATYLGRMNSTDKVTLEYLNPLLERGIDAIGYLADNLGKTNDEVYDMISKGQLDGSDAARVIVGRMEADNQGAMDELSATYAGLTSTLEDAQAQRDAAMGEGYMNARKSAMEEEIAFLGSGSTDEMYRLIGEYQASLENAKEQAVRDAMAEAMSSVEYTRAFAADDGAEMGRILAEAESNARAEYEASEGYQEYLATQRQIVEDTRDALYADGTYWQLGYDLGLEFNKGIAAAAKDHQAEALAEAADAYFADFASRVGSHSGTDAGTNVTVTGNTFTVREEADVNKVAEALARLLSEAKEMAGWR